MNAEHATQPLDDNTLTLRKEDLEDLLDRAAEKGAERALVHLGLEGPHAAQDIRELRDLLEAWRDARRTAWRTVIRVATTSLLVVALLGAAIKFKFMGGSQ
jgi:predicted aconitase